MDHPWVSEDVGSQENWNVSLGLTVYRQVRPQTPHQVSSGPSVADFHNFGLLYVDLHAMLYGSFFPAFMNYTVLS